MNHILVIYYTTSPIKSQGDYQFISQILQPGLGRHPSTAAKRSCRIGPPLADCPCGRFRTINRKTRR